MRMRNVFACSIYLLTICLMVAPPLFAEQAAGLSSGQSVYVPAYSHIYIGNKERPLLLTVTLSIRNIDPKNHIIIVAADYYETQGYILKKHVNKPITLKPLESLRYVVPQKDKSGGSGANFIVEWKSEQPVNSPIIETVMIGAQSGQGISFTSRGRVIIKTDRKD